MPNPGTTETNAEAACCMYFSSPRQFHAEIRLLPSEVQKVAEHDVCNIYIYIEPDIIENF